MGNSPGDETNSPVIRVYDGAGNVIETHEHTGACRLERQIQMSVVSGRWSDGLPRPGRLLTAYRKPRRS
jgi:hypothetical protein